MKHCNVEMKLKCCVPTCGLECGELYQFPKPEANGRLFKQWVDAIGGELLSLDHHYIYNNRFICSKHFEKFALNKMQVHSYLSDDKEVSKNSPLTPIDNEIKPVEFLKCKNIEDPIVLETNSNPIYVLQKGDGLGKPNLIVLQPIKKVPKKDVVPSNLQSDPCNFQKEIPNEQIPKQPEANQSTIESINHSTAVFGPVNLNVYPDAAQTSYKIKFEPSKNSFDVDVEIDDSNNLDANERSIACKPSLCVVTESDDVHEITSEGGSMGKKKAIIMIDNLSLDEVNQMNIINGQGSIETFYLSPNNFSTIKDIVKQKSIGQSYSSDTNDPAHLRKLPRAEFEAIKNVIKSYEDEYIELNKVIHSLESEVQQGKIKINELQQALVGARKISRLKSFNFATRDMSEGAKVLIKMQIERSRRKTRPRPYSLKEKLFALALYKRSKKVYVYLSTMLAMPKPKTLDSFMSSLHNRLVTARGSRRKNRYNSSHNKDGAIKLCNTDIDKCSEDDRDELEADNDQTGSSESDLDTSNKGTSNSMINDSDEEYAETYVGDSDRSRDTQCHDDVQYQEDEASESYQCEDASPPGYCDIISSSNDQDDMSQDPDTLSGTVDEETCNNNNIVAKDETEANSVDGRGGKGDVTHASAVKKNKIDSILSKMMTAEQLKGLVNMSEVRRRVGVRKRRKKKSYENSKFEKSNPNNSDSLAVFSEKSEIEQKDEQISIDPVNTATTVEDEMEKL